VCLPLLAPHLPPWETGKVEVGVLVGAEEAPADEGTVTVERVDGRLLDDFVPLPVGFVLLLPVGFVLLLVGFVLLLDDFVPLLVGFVLLLVGFVLLLDDFVLVLELDEVALEEVAAPRAVVAYHSEDGIPKHPPTVTPCNPRLLSSERIKGTRVSAVPL